jgi:hypothetical protein
LSLAAAAYRACLARQTAVLLFKLSLIFQHSSSAGFTKPFILQMFTPVVVHLLSCFRAP